MGSHRALSGEPRTRSGAVPSLSALGPPRLDAARLKPGRSNKRKSEEVNGEVKQEVMSVEKEEEELEEVRADGGRGLGSDALARRAACSPASPHPLLVSPSRNKTRKG